MLELFNDIDINQIEQKESFQNNKRKEFDNNLVYVEYTDTGLKFINLIDEGCDILTTLNKNGIKISKKIFNENKFLDNLKSIDFLSDFYQEIIKKKKEEGINFNLFEYLSKDNILRFSKEKNDIEYNIDAQNMKNNQFSGTGKMAGPNSWIIDLDYYAPISSKHNNYFKEFKEKFFFMKIEYFVNKINIALTTKNKITNKLKFNLNIFGLENELDKFNKFKLNFDNLFNYYNKYKVLNDKYSSIQFENQFIDLNLNLDKPTILINNFFNLNKKFTIKDFQLTILDYYVECLISTNIIKEKRFCSICNSTKDLMINSIYLENKPTNTHIFNLMKEISKNKYIEKSNFLCKECNNVITNMNNKITTTKNYNLKFAKNNITNKISYINSFSEIHSKGKKNFSYNTFYEILQDNSSSNTKGLFFKELFTLKNLISISEMQKNFNLLQILLKYNTYSLDSEKYVFNFLDDIYKDINKIKKTNEIRQIYLIKKNKKNLLDFWLYNKSLSLFIINSFIETYIETYLYPEKGKKNILSLKMNELFSFQGKKYTKEEIKELNLNNNCSDSTIKIGSAFYKIKEPIINQIIKKDTNMYEKQKELSSKLEVFEEKNLLEFDIKMSNNEYWILIGTIISYLESKNKSDNDKKTMLFLSNYQNISIQKIINELYKLMNKYGYEIKQSQKKFRNIYSYIIESLIEGKIELNNESKIYLFIGLTNGTQVIKLTNTKENKDEK